MFCCDQKRCKSDIDLAESFQITILNELFQSLDVLKQKNVHIAGNLVEKYELAGNPNKYVVSNKSLKELNRKGV